MANITITMSNSPPYLQFQIAAEIFYRPLPEIGFPVSLWEHSTADPFYLKALGYFQ